MVTSSSASSSSEVTYSNVPGVALEMGTLTTTTTTTTTTTQEAGTESTEAATYSVPRRGGGPKLQISYHEIKCI